MAMTKAEKQVLENVQAALRKARQDVEIATALSWPSYHAPATIPPPENGHTVGWFAYPNRTMSISLSWRTDECVVRGWSESVSHGEGPHRERGRGRTASQNGKAVYRTKADALRAVRLAMTLEFATRLQALDAAIEAAEGEE